MYLATLRTTTNVASDVDELYLALRSSVIDPESDHMGATRPITSQKAKTQ